MFWRLRNPAGEESRLVLRLRKACKQKVTGAGPSFRCCRKSWVMGKNFSTSIEASLARPTEWPLSRERGPPLRGHSLGSVLGRGRRPTHEGCVPAESVVAGHFSCVAPEHLLRQDLSLRQEPQLACPATLPCAKPEPHIGRTGPCVCFLLRREASRRRRCPRACARLSMASALEARRRMGRAGSCGSGCGQRLEPKNGCGRLVSGYMSTSVIARVRNYQRKVLQ